MTIYYNTGIRIIYDVIQEILGEKRQGYIYTTWALILIIRIDFIAD